MASCILVTGLPRSLLPLPPGAAPTCVPCIEGRQRAAPHSSEFPPTEAPLQTLHVDVWDPARVRGQGHERYFLLVVDDYSRYTTVFTLRRKGEVTKTFTLPASPQQNGIAERRIGMVINVARTSMIHAAAPHFLWPFAVQYAVHQINLQPWVSMLEITPSLRWTGKVGDASAFRVWGSQAFVRDLSADKLSSCVVPYVFLGFPSDAPSWQFYHPTSRRVLSSQDVTFDETVDAVKPVEVAVDFGAARGAEPRGAEPAGAELGVAESGVAESGGAEPKGAEPAHQLREWFARRWSRAAGAGGTTGAGDPAAAGAPAAARADGGSRATGPGGARTGGAGAAGPGGAAGAGAAGGAEAGGAVGASDAGGAGAGGAARAGAPVGAGADASGAAGGAAGGAGGAGGTAEDGAATGGAGSVPASSEGAARPHYVPLLLQSSWFASASSSSPWHAPDGSAPFHCTAACPFAVSSKVPLPAFAGLESDSLRGASPTVTRLLATFVTDPSFESTATSALVAELVDFAAHCRLDYAASLVVESECICPPSVGGECALGTDVLEDRQEDFECFAATVPYLVSMLIAPEGDPDAPDIPAPRSFTEAIEGPYSSQWKSAMDAKMAS
ncbi:unnamed protein product [Closterium sp. NIES-64]|nr:unnamed protein product [Closterium sp. NIES-64]